MKNPEVSIILPAYNAGQTITETLESLIKQSFENFEIVIVNDGSTDNTEKIILEFQKKFPRKIVYLKQKNKGLAGARNTGLKNAKGKFISWIDSDDIWLKERLEKMYNFLKKNKDIDFVTTDAYLWYPPSRPKISYYQKYKYPFSGDLKDLLKNNFIFGSPLFKRKVFEKVGFLDEKLRSAEDYDYWIRVALSGFKIRVIPEVLALYRQREGSLSKDETSMELNIAVMWEKHLRNSHLNKKEKEMIKNNLSKIYFSLAFKNIDNPNKAKEYLKKIKSFKSSFVIFLLNFKLGKTLFKKFLSIKKWLRKK